jgi:hypothetical protein
LKRNAQGDSFNDLLGKAISRDAVALAPTTRAARPWKVVLSLGKSSFH